MGEQPRTVREVLRALDDWVEQQQEFTQQLLNQAAAERKGHPRHDSEQPPDPR